MAKGVKKILDSVHGYVSIPAMYVDNIIDTPQFQRLRRIEQTSCRALFPSARHDRFIHSIGVFYLGTLICEHLWEDNFSDEEKHNAHLISIIITYRLACLLHDIGHTPFSHTFEEFFDHKSNDLVHNLALLIQEEDPNFENEFESQFTSEGKLRFAPHEVLSAIISIRDFKNIITDEHNEWGNHYKGGNPSLLARMIVGCRYNTAEKSLEDAFIDLIHGDIIDADGLDYVCRDVWASGYSTSKVDVSRLINSIHIKEYEGKYVVCYSDKALNEIKSVLQVKNFQNDIVFNHHTVILEQELLKQAMQSAAIKCMLIQPQEKESVDDLRLRAIHELCDIKLYDVDGFTLKNGEVIISPMDDDFIHLMKEAKDDKFVSQWLSRRYDSIPLWKRQEAFLSVMDETLRADYDNRAWIFSNDCKQFLAEVCETTVENIKILKIKPKDRLEKLNLALIYTGDKVCKYIEIFPLLNKDEQTEEVQEFIDKQNKNRHPLICYILIPKEKENRRTNIQKALVEQWKRSVRKEDNN